MFHPRERQALERILTDSGFRMVDQSDDLLHAVREQGSLKMNIYITGKGDLRAEMWQPQNEETDRQRINRQQYDISRAEVIVTTVTSFLDRAEDLNTVFSDLPHLLDNVQQTSGSTFGRGGYSSSRTVEQRDDPPQQVGSLLNPASSSASDNDQGSRTPSLLDFFFGLDQQRKD